MDYYFWLFFLIRFTSQTSCTAIDLTPRAPTAHSRARALIPFAIMSVNLATHWPVKLSRGTRLELRSNVRGGPGIQGHWKTPRLHLRALAYREDGERRARLSLHNTPSCGQCMTSAATESSLVLPLLAATWTISCSRWALACFPCATPARGRISEPHRLLLI